MEPNLELLNVSDALQGRFEVLGLHKRGTCTLLAWLPPRRPNGVRLHAHVIFIIFSFIYKVLLTTLEVYWPDSHAKTGMTVVLSLPSPRESCRDS